MTPMTRVQPRFQTIAKKAQDSVTGELECDALKTMNASLCY